MGAGRSAWLQMTCLSAVAIVEATPSGPYSLTTNALSLATVQTMRLSRTGIVAEQPARRSNEIISEVFMAINFRVEDS